VAEQDRTEQGFDDLECLPAEGTVDRGRSHVAVALSSQSQIASATAGQPGSHTSA
jgi:hypothetical protein